MSASPLQADLQAFLSQHHTLTLATQQEGTPWASTVYFASHDDLSLDFLTDPRTRRGQQLLIGTVAATVQADVADWMAIRGVQLTGEVQRLVDEDRHEALAHYLQKFPQLERMRSEPQGEQETQIVDRLLQTPLYRLQPHWIRLIDNARAFGWKGELRWTGTGYDEA